MTMFHFWLLEADTVARIEAAMLSGFQPTADQQTEFMARSSISDGGRILTAAGDRAAIKIAGVLTDTPNIMAMYFGGGNTTYGEIISAIAAAEADPSIKEIAYYVNSPGGQASALWGATMDAIHFASKPSVAYVSDAASAAYGLVSQAGSIVAENNFSMVGSVGVAAQVSTSPGSVTITSTEAPAKRPDVATPEGRELVRTQLDALHKEFATVIARGRNTTVENVNANFGRGGMVIAADAKSRGMLDKIAGPVQAVKPSKPAAPGGKTKSVAEADAMDMTKLKAEHPELYAAVLALGVTAERDRVTAHLAMGEAAEALDIAVKAIKDGTELSAAVNSQYVAAGIAASKKAQRTADEPAAVKPPNGGQPAQTDAQKAYAENVVALIEKAEGVPAKTATK